MIETNLLARSKKSLSKKKDWGLWLTTELQKKRLTYKQALLTKKQTLITTDIHKKTLLKTPHCLIVAKNNSHCQKHVLH